MYAIRSYYGWQPTQEYLEGTYGIKVQPMPDKGSNPIANKKLGKLLHFSATKPGDAIDAGIGVITSYSIHYTKLYERITKRCSPTVPRQRSKARSLRRRSPKTRRPGSYNFV